MTHKLQDESFVEEMANIPLLSHLTPKWINYIKKESFESEPTSVLVNRRSPSPPNGGGIGVEMEGLCFEGEGSFLPCFIDDPIMNLNFRQLVQPPAALGFDNCDEFGATINHFNVMESLGYNLVDNSGGLNSFPNYGVVNVNPQFDFRDQETQTLENPNGNALCIDYGELGFPSQVSAKRPNAGVVIDSGIVQVGVGSLLGEDHEIMNRKQIEQFYLHQELLMGLVPWVGPLHSENGVEPEPQNCRVLALCDEIVRIAEMFQSGNFALAQVILARLNHLVSLPGKPIVKATALFVKEELERLLKINNPSGALPLDRSLTATDVVNKMSAYKLFSEVSPIMQFVDFTCTQTLLEALDEFDSIHVLDFDIGCGSMWASFIRELSLRKRGAPLLKISAFASASTCHPVELVALVCNTILEFAAEFGISVDVQVVNLDTFDPVSCTLPNFHLNENEAAAVNFPIEACSHCPFLLSPLLSLVKKCTPKIMISVSKGSDHCELSFPSHILRVLDSCTNLLDSLEGSDVASHIVNKIEKHLIQPMVERNVLGRIRAPDKLHANKMLHWKSIFASAGFLPYAFSPYSESQADQLVNRIGVKGFHIEKRQTSLVLNWLCHELVAASAWKC